MKKPNNIVILFLLFLISFPKENYSNPINLNEPSQIIASPVLENQILESEKPGYIIPGIPAFCNEQNSGIYTNIFCLSLLALWLMFLYQLRSFILLKSQIKKHYRLIEEIDLKIPPSDARSLQSESKSPSLPFVPLNEPFLPFMSNEQFSNREDTPKQPNNSEILSRMLSFGQDSPGNSSISIFSSAKSVASKK